jgi:methionine-rich copper-binding protein CopC
VVKTHGEVGIAAADWRLYIAHVRNVAESIRPGLDSAGGYMILPSYTTRKWRQLPLRGGVASSALFVLFILLLTAQAWGHAILVRSSPKANEVVASGDLKLELEFNARVDAARSTLHLLTPSGETEKLELLPQPSPAILAARASRLAPGAYSIRWQVLTNDGHITRGEVPFKVK